MARPTSTCAICLEDKPLCNSHIYPEFLYETTLGPVRRGLKVDVFNLDRRAIVQDGVKQYLLCEDCEGLANTYETAFCTNWRDRDIPARVWGYEPYVARDLDYPSFKLFHLTNLYRAAKCTANGFSGFSLPDEADARIREMIHKKEPGPDDLYPLWAVVMHRAPGIPATDLIASPFSVVDPEGLDEAGECYCLAYAGCAWCFQVSGKPPPETEHIRLRQDGTLVLDWDLPAVLKYAHQARTVAGLKPGQSRPVSFRKSGETRL